MKIFRWLGIILSAALVLSCVGILAAVGIAHLTEGKPDRTGSYASINTLIEKPANWQRFVDTPRFNEFDFPRIDGSTVTVPMTMEIARQLAGATEPVAQALTNHWTTHDAYLHLLDGTCDVILVTEPSQAELDLAAQKGIELDAQPFALDAFVFITHRNNPVETLTLAQIQGIYQKRITNWKEVGGSDKSIVPFQREANSGSQTTMEQVVMKGTAMSSPETVTVVSGMGALIEVVAEYRNGAASIGYTFAYYIQNLYRNDAIKELAVEGVAPTFEHVRDRSYPFTTAYYVVVRKGDTGKGSIVRDFLLSDAGQKSVAQAGFCPLQEVK
jgi:phosphate transport system substrate-binding protein